MTQQNVESRFRTVGDGSGSMPEDLFFREEVQLALRNRGMPLEALRYPVTPTGLHYLLVHYDIPYVDPQSWKLNIGGLVSHSLELSLDDIKERPSCTIAVTMECAGNGRALLRPRAISQPWLHEAIGTAEWAGTPLKGLLEEAGLRDQAQEVIFTGLDQGVEGQQVQYYQRSLKIEDATRDEVLLAYEMNGQPLQPQHGYPLRLIVPGWYGMTSVKWLSGIEIVGQPFEGYQMNAYRYCEGIDDPGERVTRIRVRSLMIPPGIPDFMTRTRLVSAGTVELRGRAWAGFLEVSRVEVSDNGGAAWGEARLGEQVSPFAWRDWSYQWSARPGKYALCVRATDSQGNVQPVEQPWNFRGMGNNMVHWVDVIVE